ncbi:hypothetical protein DPMN_068365 [Dreissena polymorpha]|uniref:Uncharacterized protein n=1 Tax=Dreissena polymorpha TaxID=45954 RepID=A0A9D3Z1H3_DREPO|nr:hypothetical protein DPMN_068365 [Dreissena polymorpha]
MSSAACMAYQTKSRRPEPQYGFASTLSVLGTAVLGHFHYLPRANPSKSWIVSLPLVRPARPLRCHHRCSRPSSGDVVKSLSSYGQLPFRLAILPSSVSQQGQQESTSGLRDDGTRLITAARRSSHIRPSSDGVVKPLFTYNVRTITISVGDSSESSRKSSAGDSCPGRDMHAPAADRAPLN